MQSDVLQDPFFAVPKPLEDIVPQTDTSVSEVLCRGAASSGLTPQLTTLSLASLAAMNQSVNKNLENQYYSAPISPFLSTYSIERENMKPNECYEVSESSETQQKDQLHDYYCNDEKDYYEPLMKQYLESAPKDISSSSLPFFPNQEYYQQFYQDQIQVTDCYKEYMNSFRRPSFPVTQMDRYNYSRYLQMPQVPTPPKSPFLGLQISGDSANGGRRRRHSTSHRACANCRTSDTPMWRHSPNGDILCNACGIYQSSHNGQQRPLNLTKRGASYGSKRSKSSGRDADKNESSDLKKKASALLEQAPNQV